MGSDPQSHLEEQNFLIVGKRKIRERDYVDIVVRLNAIELLLEACVGKPLLGEATVRNAKHATEILLRSMKDGTGL